MASSTARIEQFTWNLPWIHPIQAVRPNEIIHEKQPLMGFSDQGVTNAMLTCGINCPQPEVALHRAT
eukprot:scaffold479659_cov31-Prasinocladus_malaysianus.AAC.1